MLGFNGVQIELCILILSMFFMMGGRCSLCSRDVYIRQYATNNVRGFIFGKAGFLY